MGQDDSNEEKKNSTSPSGAICYNKFFKYVKQVILILDFRIWMILVKFSK